MSLWYLRDEDGIIYSLRAKAYVGEGSDEEKLEFLQQRARLDYLVAEPFEIPKRFHVKIGVDHESKAMPVKAYKSHEKHVEITKSTFKSLGSI